MQRWYAQDWWRVGFRGLLALGLGIVVCSGPGWSHDTLIAVFTTSVVLGGLGMLLTARRRSFWPLTIEGLMNILVGAAVMAWPLRTLALIGNLLALWLVVTGVGALVEAYILHRTRPGRWLLGLSGVGALVVGLCRWVTPWGQAFTLPSVLGSYAILLGIALLLVAVRLRQHVAACDSPLLPTPPGTHP